MRKKIHLMEFYKVVSTSEHLPPPVLPLSFSCVICIFKKKGRVYEV